MFNLSKSKAARWLNLLIILIIAMSLLVACKNQQAEKNQKTYNFTENKQGIPPQDGLYLAPVKIGFLWGYIDQNGEIELEPQYWTALSFSEDLALVLTDNGYIYIDKNGSAAFALDVENAKSFSEGLACVKSNEKWGYIDMSGNFVIEPRFDKAESFYEGLAAVSENGIKSGYINPSGEYVIEPKYDMALAFSNGMAFVYPNFEGPDLTIKSAYIDHDGHILLQPDFPGYNFDIFSEGLAMVYDRKNLRYGYMNKYGEIVIEPRFQSVLPFSESLALVQDESIYQYIDAEGNTIISDVSYTRARNFSDGIAAIMLKNRWGFIDKQGKLLIDCDFRDVGNFSKVD